MQVYTSYYYKYPIIKKTGLYTCYCISNGNPYNLPVLKGLVPEWNLVRQYQEGKINIEGYTQIYIEQLEDTCKDLNVIAKLLDNSCLFCFERMGKFCHRHVFTEWFNQNYGQEVVKEYYL
jgi:hypothetical protein